MKLLISSLLITFAASLTQAATINVGQGFGTNVGVVASLENGTALSAGGYYVAVGSFTTVPTVAPANTDSAASLLAAVNSFNIFGSFTAPTAAGATLGSIAGSVTATGGGNASLFNTKQIYFLVGNQATKELSTQFGIFSVATSFPANVTLAGATAVTVSGVNSITPLTNAGSEFDTIGGKDTFSLVNTVPEPSIALLGALGIFGLVRRRR